MRLTLAPLLVLGMAACTAIPVSPTLLARQCAEQARAALGPTGRVSVGVNSNTGPFTGAEVAISSDFIRGLAPESVYDRCWFDRTGELPTIPLVLPAPS